MSKYFKRVIQISTGGILITNDVLHIEFEVPFDDDHTPNQAWIEVYNLSLATIAKIKRGNRLIMNAGYQGDVGEILNGKITRVWSDKAGPDRATLIEVTDFQGTTNEKKVDISFKKNVKSSTIITAVAAKIGLKLKVLKLPNDKVHKKGYNANGMGVEVIRSIAEDCGASFYPILGQWYVRDIRQGDNTKFELSSGTGLIGSPERFSKSYQNTHVSGYQVRALLQHRVKTAAILTLNTKTARGKYRVISGKHIANAQDFQTHVEVIS